MNLKLKEKLAIVTGSHGSIGQAICLKLNQMGYEVLGIDNEKNISTPVPNHFIQLDLKEIAKNSAEWQIALTSIKDWIGSRHLRLLVNNAALQVVEKTQDISRESWKDTFDVNLTAPFFLSQELLELFCKSEGSIINISSIHARLTKPNFVAYATSKAALSGLTRAMAVDLGDSLRVNGVEPAAIHTRMLEAGFGDELAGSMINKIASFHPQNKIGKPEEVAALVYALADGEFKFLHGACIDMSGGISSRLHDPE
jgi:NAD(P)-dependent dehydrogenase (short-subunit alcohol dehydrogenase family)